MSIKQKILLGDIILHEMVRLLNLKWNNKENLFQDKDGDLVYWDTLISWNISGEAVQINFWGDGTVEFQVGDEESTNWYDFDMEFLTNIINVLKEY